jgi:hypothetical protein
MPKKIAVPEELQAEAVAPEETVEVVQAVVEPVIDRFELADQVRVRIALLPTGERVLYRFALLQEIQELYEKK